MIYEVTTDQAVNWSAKGAERIAQNVLNLIKTKRYDVAYNRTMGIDPEVFDGPVSAVEAALTNEIVEQVSLYEPRATVEEVKLIEVSDDGQIIIKVVLDI